MSVCLQDPAFDVDLVVNADLAAMLEVWLGRIALADALTAGTVRLDGPPSLTRAFPSWLALSPVAYAVRRALT